MEFYLDNAATTKPSEGTVSLIQKQLTFKKKQNKTV